MLPETVLSEQAVRRLLLDRSLPEGDRIVFYFDPNSPNSAPAWLSPMVQVEFMKDSTLGMLFGNEPGYAWISSNVIRALQIFAIDGDFRIRNCLDLIRAMEKLGYNVRQVGAGQRPADMVVQDEDELEFNLVRDAFIKRALVPTVVGIACFALGAWVSSMFPNWFDGVGNWLVGGSWAALIGAWIAKKLLSERTSK